MSEEDKGFLARWSERKRDAAKAEAEEKPKEQPSTEAKPASETPAEAEPPFDLSSLPKLEDITADTDITVFFKKGVPESIRNSVLRKSWALDPAIRNYVNPALDYAYDWNVPGGVPGGGELAPGTDVARMVAQVFGQLESLEPVNKPQQTASSADESPDTEPVRQPDATLQPVRLSDAAPQMPEADRDSDVSGEPAETPESVGPHGEREGEGSSSASQQPPRKHGSARPK